LSLLIGAAAAATASTAHVKEEERATMKTTAFGFYPRMFFYKAAVKVYRIAMLANKS